MCGDFVLLYWGDTGIVYIPVRHGLCIDKYYSRHLAINLFMVGRDVCICS